MRGEGGRDGVACLCGVGSIHVHGGDVGCFVCGG